MRRHLLYYIYPVSIGGVWQWNVEQLLRRIDQFDGVRVCAIATRGRAVKAIDDPRLVEEALAGHGFKFIRVKNRPSLGEAVAWKYLWSKVPSDGAVFYAHAKGVTKPQHPTETFWTQTMYETLLDYPSVIEDELSRHPVTGSFKSIGPAFKYMPACLWHYSGSFAWARGENAERIAASCPRKYAGTEAIWGTLFPAREAGCVFHAATMAYMNMYDESYVDSIVRPAYSIWKGAHT